MMMTSIGAMIIAQDTARSLVRFRLKLYFDIHHASIRAVVSLENSAGCSLTDSVTTIHDRDPFISGAIKIVRISKPIIKK